MTINRRRFVKTSVVIGGVVGVTGVTGSVAATDDGEYAGTFELNGDPATWEGVAPEEIAGETNPTLVFEEIGGTYRVIWHHTGGQPHNFVLEDNEGNEVARTPTTGSGSEEVTFEVTEALAGGTYVCEPHAGTMRGDVEVAGVEPPEDDDGADDAGDDAGDDGVDDAGDDAGDDGADDAGDDAGGDGADDAGDDAGDDGADDAGDDDDGIPGFGVLAAIAGVGAGAGAAVANRLRGESADTESSTE